MKNDIDYEEQRTRINKMIIDMEHNVEQRSHSKERAKALDKQYQEQSKAQDRHWQWQKGIWILLMMVALWGIFTSPYLNPPENTKADNQKVEVKK